MSELVEYGVQISNEEWNEKLLDALSSNWDGYTDLMKEIMDIDTISLEDVIGKLQARIKPRKKRA